jgi:uncharacterized protein
MKPIRLQLKSLLKASSFTVAIVLFPLVGLALDVKDVPNPRKINGTWVTDMAGILDQPTQAQINSLITQLERENGAEIAVVTVTETSPSASPKEFTTALFNHWKIGKKGQNNGVLFLISKGDRRVEIETGYGVEAILPDAKVGNIIATEIIPKFKKGDFNGGTLSGTQALVVVLKNPLVSNQLTPTVIATNTLKNTSVSNQSPSAITSNTPTNLATQPSTISEDSNQDANVLWSLLGLGGLVTAMGVIAFKSSRVEIEPEGESRFKGRSRVCICANCKKRMEKVDDSIVESTLNQQEKVAQKLGSLKFEGWKCPQCSQVGFNRVTYESRSNQFRECPTCEELTVSHTTQILESPTQYSEGKQLITDKCHCCDYQIQWEEKIPRLPSPSSSSSYSSGGSSYSSGGSSSSSGSSFGGGDSGGGGAGGSW